ncbi:MAG: hypothetical protein MUP63_04215, partial [Candidatus Nanohaloarchaeota archaeon QJJ-7]|nr:hypothetical protein [Candidatus Nanohaloarchaeota archaeon QJJ-7]
SDTDHLMIDSYSDDVLLQWDASGDVRLAEGGGNVGVGVSNPSSQLDVDGNVDISNGNLNMSGNDVQLGNSGGTGTAKVQGARELYAGDETTVTTTSTSNVLKKELTMVFDSNYGKSPRYVNVLVSMSSNAEVDVTANGVTKTLSGGGMQRATFDTSGWSDGTYTTEVYLSSTDGNSASFDITEFYYVQ